MPAELCRGLFVVPLSYGSNPDATLWMVLDTGAFRTSVDPDSVERVFGQRPNPRRRVILPTGRAGALRVNRVKMQVFEHDHLSRALGRPIDGILGFPLFEKHLLVLDYPAGKVFLREEALGPPDGRNVFPTVGNRQRPTIEVDVGEARVPVLIDSGYTGSLTLHQDDPLDWAVAARPVGASARADSVEIRSAGRLANDIAFGPLSIPRPVVTLTSETRLVGTQVLSRFVLSFDQSNGRIRMAPDSDEPIRPAPPRGVGVALDPVEEGMKVLRVFDDTPAAAAGMEQDDLVVAVDGVPVAERGCREVIDPAGTRTTLTVRRDGETREVELPIVDLVP